MEISARKTDISTNPAIGTSGPRGKYSRCLRGFCSFGGFTLLELMVSVVIIAIAVVGTTHGFISVTQGRAYGRHLSVASFLAQDKLEELKAASYENIPTVAPAAEIINGIYIRSCDVDDLAGVKTITITVTFPSGLSKVHSITLTTAKAKL